MKRIAQILWPGIFIVGIGYSLAWADFPRYTIKANLNVVQKKISAQQTVEFTNNSSKELTEIFFHIYPHRKYSKKEINFINRFTSYFSVNFFPDGFQSGDLIVESIKQGNQAINFVIEGEDKTILRVPLSKPLWPRQSITLTIDFRVDIPHAYGRLGWHEDMLRLSRWYPVLSVINQYGWNNHPFYPFHRPFFSEASFYSLELTLPQNQVVIHSGENRREQINRDGTKTLFIETPLPIRDFSLALSPSYRVYEDIYENIKIKSYYLPGHEFYGKEAAQDAKDLMGFYTKRFGPSPYNEFSIVPVHLGYGGEQMSNLIFIDTRVYELPKFLKRYFDFLIAHETGHQWFYNLVGIDEFTEMWLEEGINSYFIAEYLEEKYGPRAEVIDFPYWFKKWKGLLPELTFHRTRDVRYKMIARYGYDQPIVGKLSSFQEPSSIFSLTYGKGSGVVDMLQDQIGEEAFEKVFRRVFKEFEFRNISVREFQKLCEEESNKDLEEFFHAWLYDARILDYAVEVKGDKILLLNRGQINMPVDVEVHRRDGSVSRFSWEGEKRREEYETGLGPNIKRIVIDPHQKALDIDRTNNSWPRKINVKAVPLYLPLYDIPIFLPDDGYNIVVGPEIITNGLGFKASFQKPYDQIFYAATGYEFSEQLHKTRVGYQLNNVLKTQTAFGVEFMNRTDLEDGSEDLVSEKVYLRRELWPSRYSLTSINDHISLYLLRNRGIDGFLVPAEREDSRNVSYLRRDEAIIGSTFHVGRSGPWPDPHQGFNIDTLLEHSGHFLGATQYFNRGSIDVSLYQPVTNRTQLAYRMKVAGGFPDDKNLFELGGLDGLRGYDRKTIRGANALLGSMEYRFPIIEKMRWSFLDNIFGIEAISGVAFVDVGQSWFSSFKESDLKKNAGGGLRFSVNVASFLEKIVLRLDAAQAINDSSEETQFWFGINHAF